MLTNKKGLITAILLTIVLITVLIIKFNKQKNQPITITPNASTVIINKNTISSTNLVDVNNIDNEKYHISCDSHLLEIDSLAQWKTNKIAELNQFIRDRYQEGLKENIIDFIALKSGLGVKRARNIRHYKKGDNISPRFENQQGVFTASLGDYLALKFVDSDDMLNLQNALSENRIAKDAFYPGQQSIVSLISLVIEKKNHNRDELILAIDMLLSQQVVVTYTDLVTATRYHLPIETLNDLYQSSELNANEVFKKHGKYTSLALLSLSFKYAEAALYWYEMGSSFIPATIGLNGFDLLFHFGFDNENPNHNQIFSILLKQNIIPFDPRTLSKAHQELTQEQNTTLKEKFNNNTFSLSETELKQANQYKLALFKMLLKGRVNFNIQDPLASPCFTPLAKKLMANVIKPNKRKSLIKATEKTLPPKKFEKQLSAEQINQRILDAKQLYNDKTDIEQYLSVNNNLNSKRIIEKYRQSYMMEQVSKFETKYKENLEDVKNDIDVAEVQNIIQQIMMFIQDKKWNDAINLVEQLNLSDAGSLPLLIMTSLNLNADLDFIISLLERGGSLPENAIFHFIQDGNLNAIKTLIPYGLQVNFIDPLGRTTIQNSVAYKQLSILKYLLENKLTTIEPSLGFDALHIAIKDFDMANEGIAYIAILIKYGAQIDNTHKHLMYEIQLKNPSWYEFITNIHPELKI